MCRVDGAVRQAAVTEFVRSRPAVRPDGGGHPALRGCADVPWGDVGWTGIPELLSALLDETAAAEALRVLENVLMDDLFNAAAVLPLALPFLIRLAATPDVTVRADLVELLWLTAELTHPVDEDSDIAVLMRGREADHPERARCRAVFAEQAPVIHGLLSDPALPVDVLTPDRRAALLAAAGSR